MTCAGRDFPLPAGRRARAAGCDWISRSGAAAGIAGPVAFTAAWVAASLRQHGYSPAEVQISGLAAPDARDPWIMLTGFLVLGGSLLAFAPALRHGLVSRDRAGKQGAPGAAPWLIGSAGALVIAAGLLRRDHMLLTAGPGSWHEQAHNGVSAVIYALLVVIPLVLARRLRGDPRWRGMPASLTATGAAVAIILAVFAVAGPDSPGAGALQRAGVTVSLAALVTLAARLSWRLARQRRAAGCPLPSPASS